MQTTLNIPLNSLRAALSHTPEKDVRYYLLGVYVDTRNGRVVGTDGHRMLICCGPIADCDPFIIGRDDLIRALKSYGPEYNRGKALATECMAVTVETSDRKTYLTLEGPNGAKFTAPAVDGVYPDYRRVIPATHRAIEFATYNAEYVAEAFDAIALYRNVPKKDAFKHGAGLWMQGNSPGIVADSETGVIVIIMPMRSDTTGDKFRNALLWAQWKPEAAAVAA